MEEELLTKKELGVLFKISRSTIDRWRLEGMPYEKVGRGTRFNKRTIDWIRKNKGAEK